jgi:hypothetical protein
VLPSFYCEDMVNVMNRERRREALAKFVGIVKADIERERKGRAGVENLAKALQVRRQYTVKKVSDFPVPSRDVTNQTLPGRE